MTLKDVCTICEISLPRLKHFHSLSDKPGKLIENLAALNNHLRTGEKVLVGMSGGVDSSFLAVACGEAGLPVQVIHFDNGWNTQLATRNINQIISKYNFDLHTVIQDWPTFKSLQRSFLFSGVPDIELLTDHAIFSILTQFLEDNKEIRFVLSGGNYTTEHGINDDYVWNKWDIKNIRDINQKYENISLERYPTVSMFKWIYHRKISRKRKVLVPLNGFCYKRSVALDYLGSKVNFIDYEYKHEESLLTKIFQRTILPKKYNYYKIEEHLSALVRNNELSLPDAYDILERFKLSNVDTYELNYFKEKLKLSENDWEKIISSSRRRHEDFANNAFFFKSLAKVGSLFRLRSMS